MVRIEVSKKQIIKFLCGALIVAIFIYFKQYHGIAPEDRATFNEPSAAEKFIEQRRADRFASTTSTDVFGEDNILNLLLVGLDNRAGTDEGHCDVIQFVTINKDTQKVKITAVPRGTYSPLPGWGHVSTSYYVSNACSIGGLEYGVAQMERIAGIKADYVATVGFSGVMGILRQVDLPTMATLQWLRHRQGYAIGEPQRAHNHSTFLKDMLLRFMSEDQGLLDKPLHYIVYSMLDTDLSFSQAESIFAELKNMDLDEHPENITLAMRPYYDVQDIPYDPENVANYLNTMLDPIKHLLSKKDYGEITDEAVEERVLRIYEDHMDSPDFIHWAYEYRFWEQIEDAEKRAYWQYETIARHVGSIEDVDERTTLLADYVLEMEYQKNETWIEKAKELLEKFL